MTVDDGDGIGVSDTDMVGLYPDHLSILLVRIVDGQIALSLTSLEEQPQVRERSGERRGNVLDLPIAEVWQDVVQNWEEDESIWRKEDSEKHRESREQETMKVRFKGRSY